MKKLLNLGCGNRFCADEHWTNVDFVSHSEHVRAHNLLQGVPFEDGTFDVVYHSNVLEHFHRADGANFIQECFRVLKPGGILRVVVPDLEQICRLYLESLELAVAGEPNGQNQYNWMMLEMYDQAIRTTSGGEMAKYILQLSPQDQEFVILRSGNVGREIAALTRGESEISDKSAAPATADWQGMLKTLPMKVARKGRSLGRKALLRCLSRREREAIDIGLFRTGGEVHQWMYDRYSLLILLQKTGFPEIGQFDVSSSQIENWNEYFLDIDPDGSEHAASCLFMEATKR